MAFWGAIANIGASILGSKVFKGGKKAVGVANSVLGSPLGKVGLNVLGGNREDRRTREATAAQFDFLESKGLTPWEINSGGSGGVVQPHGSTLGNVPDVQAVQQRKFIATEKEKDRRTALDVADIQSGPAHKRADIETRMEPYRRQQVDQQVKKLKQDIARGKIELKNFWPILFAKMGPDNLMIAMASMLEGVSPEQVLKSSGIKADHATRQQMESVAAWLTKYKGAIGNVQGTAKTVVDATRNILGGAK